MRRKIKILSFLIFLSSYLLGIMILLDFIKEENLILLSAGCAVSLSLFLLSHVMYVQK